MITISNFRQLLQKLGFQEEKNLFTKKFENLDCELKVDFDKQQLIYPENEGLKINERQTCNFKAPENFVVFECVHRLFCQGYSPEHIELEQRFDKIKKDDGGGRADIIVKNNNNEVLLIIECKVIGEFNKHWNKTTQDGDQLFRYLTNKRETQFLCLYATIFGKKRFSRFFSF
jgi:type I restriction enzyme M protein